MVSKREGRGLRAYALSLVLGVEDLNFHIRYLVVFLIKLNLKIAGTQLVSDTNQLKLKVADWKSDKSYVLDADDGSLLLAHRYGASYLGRPSASALNRKHRH